MKKLKINSYWDYPFNWRGPLKSLLYRNAAFFHPKPILYLLLIFLALGSLFSKKFLILFVSFFSVIIYLRSIGKRARLAFKLKRNHKSQSKEEVNLEVHYEIENSSPCTQYNLLVFDFNNATSKENYVQFHETTLEPNSRLTKQSLLKLDNGMGTKSFGPLLCLFSDVFGFNQFTYTQPRKSDIKVFPFVHPTLSPRLELDRSSLNFGEFDNYKKGNNVNFYSTREYCQGDNIKFINWKLSLKTDKLIVNEFESSANAKLYAIIIDDDRLHFGEGSDSSFEYCKDLLLSLLYSNVNSHNEMGFISHQNQIKAKPGSAHVRALELLISCFETKAFDKYSQYTKRAVSDRPTEEFFRKIRFYTDQESNLFIFTGLVPGKVWDRYLQQVFDLKKINEKLHLVVIYGYGRMLKKADKLDSSWLAEMAATAEKEVLDLKLACRKRGVTCSFIKVDAKLKYKYKIKTGFQDARS